MCLLDLTMFAGNVSQGSGEAIMVPLVGSPVV